MYIKSIYHVDILFYSPSIIACCWYVLIDYQYWVCFVMENNWYNVLSCWLCRLSWMESFMQFVESQYWVLSWPLNYSETHIDLIIYHHLHCLYHILWFPPLFMSRSLARFMPLLMKWFSYWHFKRSLTTNIMSLTLLMRFHFTLIWE
jgi:hypothetical protein